MKLLNRTKTIGLSIFFLQLFNFENLKAQDNLDSLMSIEDNNVNKNELVTATFKGTRLINFHTTEVLGRRTLEFIISHRFAEFKSGANNLYGLDGPANIRLGLEYSHDGRLMLGLGRTSSGKYIDGFLKYRLLRQTTSNSMPINVTLFTSANITTEKYLTNNYNTNYEYDYFFQRFAYASQILISRKFSKSLSLQLTPSYVHYNVVADSADQNDMFALVFSGRMKLNQRFALTAEYGLRLNDYSNHASDFYNSASIGVDIETGGHVFQLFVTNSFGINEVLSIPYTTGNWGDSGIRLGFNITRSFSFAK